MRTDLFDFELPADRIALRPVIRDGAVVARQMMNLSCSFDHRVVDGADGARFTSHMRMMLSDVRRLLL